MRRQVAHDKMMAYIRIVVDQAPPLSAEQISRLRGLLSGPKPDPSRFRRWQVKLSCGHEVSTESLDDNPPRHALDCPECGRQTGSWWRSNHSTHQVNLNRTRQSRRLPAAAPELS